jgi:CheY-like chemotaxis protein
MRHSILIVDDVLDDAALIKRAVMSLRPTSPVKIITTSRELIMYVEGEGSYGDREAFPYPGLILLDLRIPEMNGFEIMQWLREEPCHAEIPVIVVSAFDRQREIRKAYQLGARTFLSKPVSPETILSAIRALMLPFEFFD